MRLDRVNELSREEAVALLAGVVEDDEAAARYAESHRPFRRPSDVDRCFARYLDTLTTPERVEVLRRYPELGEVDGERLSKESAEEHRASGLSAMEADAAARLRRYNRQYSEKFGFPFVICAKANDVASILAAVELRLDNTREREIELAVEQVKRIAAIRVRSILH